MNKPPTPPHISWLHRCNSHLAGPLQPNIHSSMLHPAPAQPAPEALCKLYPLQNPVAALHGYKGEPPLPTSQPYFSQLCTSAKKHCASSICANLTYHFTPLIVLNAMSTPSTRGVTHTSQLPWQLRSRCPLSVWWPSSQCATSLTRSPCATTTGAITHFFKTAITF